MPWLPMMSANEACPFGIPVRVLEPGHADGNVSLFELLVLNHIVAHRAPQSLFELGTFDGRTTLNFAANAPDDAKIYTLDLPRSQLTNTRLNLSPHDVKYVDKDASGTRFADSPLAPKIEQLFGDTATFDFSPWYGKIDLVFIDASHAADYVRNDTEVAARLIGLRPGVILWHDYGGIWTGVAEILDEYERNDIRFRGLAHISGTSLAICRLNAGDAVADIVPRTDAEIALEAKLAAAYWRRNPDVAADAIYGDRGSLRIRGARQHYEDCGRSEGRTWGL